MKYANVSKEGGNECEQKRAQTPMKRKSEGLEVAPKGVETEKQRELEVGLPGGCRRREER